MSPSSQNAYESGMQKIIPAVLLYAFFENQVLMIHRNQKKNDFHEGKWNGLGGKLDLGETAIQCAAREFEEESGAKTSIEQWTWAGVLTFPNFKPHKKEDWHVSVYRTELTQEQVNQIVTTNKEGTLHWMPVSEILTLNLWEGDRIFIPHVLKKTPFEGTFFYQDGQLTQFFCNPVIR